jgi:hypothetical protein
MEDVMEIYAIGRLALPGVVGIVGIAAILTLIMGFFAFLRTLKSVRRFFQVLEETGRPLFTINVITRRFSSKPPMREQD